jgi:hypothetical protein
MEKYIKSYQSFINEEKQNDENNTSLEKTIEIESEESELNDFSLKNVDYYFLKDGIDEVLVKDMYNNIIDNEYRAFATFSDNIEYFEEMPCLLIAIVNYPPLRNNKRTIKDALYDIKKFNYVDEIEFPWDLNFKNFGVEFWREIVLNLSNDGFILRPMLEIGLWDNEQIKNCIEFLKQINIMNVMTSTGLCSELTTVEKWNSIKNLIPNKWVVKASGILSLNDIDKFLKNDIDLVATSLNLKEKES